jgi:hypothetical protein
MRRSRCGTNWERPSTRPPRADFDMLVYGVKTTIPYTGILKNLSSRSGAQHQLRRRAPELQYTERNRRK